MKLIFSPWMIACTLMISICVQLQQFLLMFSTGCSSTEELSSALICVHRRDSTAAADRKTTKLSPTRMNNWSTEQLYGRNAESQTNPRATPIWARRWQHGRRFRSWTGRLKSLSTDLIWMAAARWIGWNPNFFNLVSRFRYHLLANNTNIKIEYQTQVFT